MADPAVVRSALTAAFLWSGFVVGLVFLFPSRLASVPCTRGVGFSQTPECQAQLAAANAQVFWFQTAPLLVAIAAGYVAIFAVAVYRRRASSRRAAA